MATGDLEWQGRAWPAAVVGEKVKVRTGERGSSRFACEIATTGSGRDYKLQGAWGFWKNFATLLPDDEAAVADFVRRRGDPFGELGPDRPTDSGDWPTVSKWLAPVADFWRPPDADGVSRVIVDEKRVDTVTAMFADLLEKKAIEFKMTISGTGDLRAIMVARSLAGFMKASAFLNFQSNAEMAICQQCGDWFALQRQGTKFCSPSCRAAFSTKHKEAANG